MVRALSLLILLSLATANADANNRRQTGMADRRADVTEEKMVEECRTDTASKAEEANAQAMADTIIARLMQADEEFKAKGQEFKLAIIARKGMNPGKNVILRNFDESGNPITVQQMIDGLKQSKKRGKKADALVDLYRDDTEIDSLEYTHMGIVLKKSSILTETMIADQKAGKEVPDSANWMVVHQLKPCKTNTANLYYEGLENFFLDDRDEYGA
ncbi:MAG: DUF2145 domain-containing protein, partial [Bdellovibrionales bacterium]|nr:DUF2145 domain-containing protein [Bdellovibrionales bacterium]